MKKVLLVARYFGTRTPGLVKYLPEFGWQPVLLTAAPWTAALPQDLRVIATPYRETLGFWKKVLGVDARGEEANGMGESPGGLSGSPPMNFLMGLAGEFFYYPDAFKGWKKYAVRGAGDLLKKEKVEAVISTSSPVTAHVVAAELKKRFGVSWAADLRDPWSQNHNYRYSPVRRWFDRRLEVRTLAGADALVTVSQPWAEHLEALHRKEVRVITNGFDPAVVNIPPAPLGPKFTVNHTGNIYRGRQDPVRLLKALEKLISGGLARAEDVEARFYGPRLEWLDREIEKLGLSGVARQHGAVPHDTAVNLQRESQVLLLLDWDTPGEKGVYPLKVFEYLAARRPVLATGGVPGNVIDGLLRRTGAGVQAVSMDDIAAALSGWYNEYKTTGRVDYHGIQGEIDKHSHREMASAFAAILDGLT